MCTEISMQQLQKLFEKQQQLQENLSGILERNFTLIKCNKSVLIQSIAFSSVPLVVARG